MRHYDVVIAGGGPAGLAAALTLGRARKRVLLCDAGSPRNAAADRMHNFVTRDGTPPPEFRAIARAQLQAYPNVETQDARIEGIDGTAGAFDVRVTGEPVRAKRVLLCTGMIDEVPGIDGIGAIWGRSVFACPYCHGWEVQDRRFGYLATRADRLEFPLLLRGWSGDVVVFTNGGLAIPADVAARLAAGGVRIDERPIRRLLAEGEQLTGIELEDGTLVPRDVLFVHAPQRQPELVRALGVELDEHGLVRVKGDSGETSIPGIYAAGDLTTHAQTAILAAAAGMRTASMLNMGLTLEMALDGSLQPSARPELSHP